MCFFDEKTEILYCQHKFINEKTVSLMREDDIFPYIKNVCVWNDK